MQKKRLSIARPKQESEGEQGEDEDEENEPVKSDADNRKAMRKGERGKMKQQRQEQLMALQQQAAQEQAQQFHEVEGLLRSGKPALSVSESKRVADFLARQKDVMILCGRPAK